MSRQDSSAAFTTPTTELAAINAMLSGIGEAPVNSLSDATADVSVARSVLAEVSREVQAEGWQWNTDDDFPLRPDASGAIRLHPSVIRLHFREPDERQLILRGDRVYDRKRHTFLFPADTLFLVTLTALLPFDQLPETCRRYVTLKALRVFQERVVGSSTLSSFQQRDEAVARAAMLAEERRADRPNMLRGTLAPAWTWRPALTLLHRGPRRW